MTARRTRTVSNEFANLSGPQKKTRGPKSCTFNTNSDKKITANNASITIQPSQVGSMSVLKPRTTAFKTITDPMNESSINNLRCLEALVSISCCNATCSDDFVCKDAVLRRTTSSDDVFWPTTPSDDDFPDIVFSKESPDLSNAFGVHSTSAAVLSAAFVLSCNTGDRGERTPGSASSEPSWSSNLARGGASGGLAGGGPVASWVGPGASKPAEL
mmetsp:Transcript_62060/g.189517  ORF Transcript_62060/g.189517 Transcript_62060/m.189517 type:complete len:215 (-) Transcript_62060:683-1327(-)